MIKIGHTLGPRFKPFNGVGQGDPLSLFPAVLLVQWQFGMLRRKVSGGLDSKQIAQAEQDAQAFRPN